MATLAGVGSYGIVFHTKIVRSSRRACNFEFKRRVRASGIFDSHRPLHFSVMAGLGQKNLETHFRRDCVIGSRHAVVLTT